MSRSFWCALSMAKMVLTVDGVILREFPLDRDVLSIGRKAQNDIPIDDITISSKHAVIRVEKNAYMDSMNDVYIEDLDSTNGTLVNGQRIKKHMLRHGDVVQIGRHEFKFMDEDAPDFEKTIVMKPEAAINKTRGLPPAAVKVLNGPKAGQALDLLKSYTTMGNAGSTVIISKRSNGYFIAHIQGKGEKKTGKAPMINGKPIGAQSLPLNDRDVIDMSGMQLEFFLKPSA